MAYRFCLLRHIYSRTLSFVLYPLHSASIASSNPAHPATSTSSAPASHVRLIAALTSSLSRYPRVRPPPIFPSGAPATSTSSAPASHARLIATLTAICPNFPASAPTPCISSRRTLQPAPPPTRRIPRPPLRALLLSCSIPFAAQVSGIGLGYFTLPPNAPHRILLRPALTLSVLSDLFIA